MEGRLEAIVGSAGYNYLLYRPADYEKADKWPLILFLHGAGERGDNLDLLKKLGIPKIVERGDNLPFIGVSPQCGQGRHWENIHLITLLNEIIATHKIDPDRIYLTGVSMGGYGVWRLAAEIPDTFAAIAPVCCGGDPSFAFRIREIPAWVFHGAKDDVVPLSQTEEMVKALERIGGNVRFTVYPDAGHDSWTATYDNPELFEWFLSHRKERSLCI